MAVNVHHVWRSLNTHAGIDLPDVALEILALGVIDTEPCCSLNPQCSLQRLLNADDVAVG